MSEPAFGEPALDLVEAVESPERLLVDEHERRTEHAGGERFLPLAAKLVLDRRVVDRRPRALAIVSGLRRDVGRDLGIGNVALVDEVRAIQRVHERRATTTIETCLPEHDAR